jgi:hypothetical protein
MTDAAALRQHLDRVWLPCTFAVLYLLCLGGCECEVCSDVIPAFTRSVTEQERRDLAASPFECDRLCNAGLSGAGRFDGSRLDVGPRMRVFECVVTGAELTCTDLRQCRL